MNTRNAPSHRWPSLVALTAVFTLAIFFASTPAYGQANQYPPGKMTFQGFLTDASSPPVPLGNTTPENKSVDFKIYKSAQGAASTDVVWAESQVVTVDKGHFSVLLGEGSGVSGLPHNTDLSGVFIGSDASERWIGITVDGTEITPRIQFFAAPYAQLAKAASSLTAGAVASGNVTAGGLLSSTGSAAGLAFEDRTSGGTPWQWYSDGGNARLWHGGDKMTVSDSGRIGAAGLDVTGTSLLTGNVGIGTVSPTQKLDVNGNIASTGSITSSGRIGAAGLDVTGTSLLTGNVGIGTVSPTQKLDVNGNIASTGSVTSSGSTAGLIFNNRDGAGAWTWYSQGGSARLWNGTDKLTVSPGGYVNVAQGLGITAGNVFDLAVGAVGRQGNAGQMGYELFGAGRVHIVGAGKGTEIRRVKIWDRVESSGFDTVSDARIKEIVQRSDTQHDLETIRGLLVTDYRLVDRAAGGNLLQKGFIAQEVAVSIPEAVTSGPGFVPDIYASPLTFDYDAGQKILSVSLSKPHGLKPGDRVWFVADDSMKVSTVVDVLSATQFATDNFEKKPGKVLVYGREVTDFRTLDYDRVFTTGIGAIQELARQVEVLKKSEARIAELEQKTARMAELEAKAARVDSLEREMAQLKKLVAELASVAHREAEPVATSSPSEQAIASVNQ